MIIQRELSIEERCAFANLLGDQRLTDIVSRYTPMSIRTLGVFVTGGMTIADMHARLDQSDAPRYTDNPYPAFEVLDFISSTNARLYAVQLQEDGRLKHTHHGYLEILLGKALSGKLKRKDNNLVFFRNDCDQEVQLEIRPGDFLVRRPVDLKTYAYWLPPRDGETEEVK